MWNSTFDVNGICTYLHSGKVNINFGVKCIFTIAKGGKKKPTRTHKSVLGDCDCRS
jgi:hypothetical protein